MKVTIIKANDEQEKIQMAKLALEMHLYVPSWTMQGAYADIKSGENVDYDFAMAFSGKKVLGCIILNKMTGEVDVFVKKEYRRQGVGSKLIQMMKEHNNEVSGHFRGAKGSIPFFESCQVLDVPQWLKD